MNQKTQIIIDGVVNLMKSRLDLAGFGGSSQNLKWVYTATCYAP